MNLWSFTIVGFMFFGLTACEEVVVEDATFSGKNSWFKNVYLLIGTGQQWNENGGGYACGNGEKAEMWLLINTVNSKKTLNDVQIHITVEAGIEKCDGGTKECFKNGFELYRYLGDNEPRVPYENKIDSKIEEEKRKAREYFRTNFTVLGNITGNATSGERVNSSLTLHLKKLRAITFAIKSNGGCGNLFRMKVYYYSCKSRFINSVMFKETLSPPNGTRTVFGNCSVNSLPTESGDLRAHCHSNGTWSTNGDIECRCNKGYEPTTDRGCSPCLVGQYKPSLSNRKCEKCPKNAISTEKNTTCKCKNEYYILPNDSKKPSNCYAPLYIENKPVITLDDGSANVTWLPPMNNSEINEIVTYDIRCYVCIESVCNESCTGAHYTPGHSNITQTFVRVSGLVVGQKYQFKIFPKNSLNKNIPQDKWTFISSKRFSIKPNVNNKQSTDKKDFPYLVIIVCVGSVTAFLVVFFIAFHLRKRKGKKSGLFQGLSNGVELPTVSSKTYVDPTNYDRPEDAISEFATEIDASLLYLEMLIGGGEFGDVYKGSMTGQNGKKFPVAVKTLKKGATTKSETDFLLEASVMGQFDCSNVVKLEGVVTKYRPWMIVIEFMSNGSLDNFLKANDGRLSHLELINMARGVVAGMEYLAGMNFVHRDLAARNVLVDGNLGCKVSDFGLSRELEATDSSRGEYATTGGRIPIRWTAPEAIKYRKFSTASDVWSFGILLWEIMSFAERPYWEWDNFKVMEEVDEGFRLPAPLNCPKGVHDLMMQCWRKDRVERPSFPEMTVVIDGWIQSPKSMEGDVDLSAALREWLESIKMCDYLSNFISAGYQRPCELFGIKEENLKEMGISLVGHRNKIMKGIMKLQGNKKTKRALQKEISLEV